MKDFYNKLIQFLEKFLNNKYWYLITSIIVALVILFLTTPSYYALTKGFKPCVGCVDFQDEINRADHILKPTIYGKASHMANLQLRLTVPMIAKLIGTRSKIVIFIIQEILGVGFLIITCLLSYRITKDKVIAAILTLSMGFIYAGKAAFVDVEGFTDSYAYFFLVLALFTLNKPLILISLTLAYFTDERALLASSLIAVFYFLEFLDINKGKIDFYSVIKSRVFYIILSWIFCFLIRFILFKLYGLNTPSSAVVIPDFHRLGYIFWDGLQGFWLLLAGGVLYLIIEKRFFILSLLILSFLVMVISTAMIYDFTRSIAYIFPIIFIALYLTEKAINKLQLRKLMIITCLICFLCGDGYFGEVNSPDYYQSVPVKIINKAFFHQQ
ncbi:hypothetical protein [Mucilaginibacter sp.]|uniref:hypothetical protein n=1 Tax=Mucilaginibacter sp. TaxID=1882438 RepID=UPI002849CB4C|nr:hypothetical protein [Mucilaginibacter sp.]MDR3695459.1 hypothetical protein [Mucilaginibacter sp.]